MIPVRWLFIGLSIVAAMIAFLFWASDPSVDSEPAHPTREMPESLFGRDSAEDLAGAAETDIDDDQAVESSLRIDESAESQSPRPKFGLRSEPCGHGLSQEDVEKCVGRAALSEFAVQSRDTTWAASTESQILGSLTQLSAEVTVSGLNVECRETLCRLQIAFPSVGALRRATAPVASNGRAAIVSELLIPMSRQANLQLLFIPIASEAELLERTYFLAR